jgi:hypothetical protein
MRSPEEIHLIIKKIAESEGYPINYILKNIMYFSDKYSANIDKKEIENLNNSLKIKLKIDYFTTLKLDIFQ